MHTTIHFGICEFIVYFQKTENCTGMYPEVSRLSQ